jgi:hypothetical protein
MHTDLLHYYAAGIAAAEAYPDARGCSFRPETEQQLVVVYADMSVIVWDIQDVKKVSHCSCTLAHPTTAGNLVSSMHNSLHTAMSPDLANADFKLLDFLHALLLANADHLLTDPGSPQQLHLGHQPHHRASVQCGRLPAAAAAVTLRYMCCRRHSALLEPVSRRTTRHWPPAARCDWQLNLRPSSNYMPTTTSA